MKTAQHCEKHEKPAETAGSLDAVLSFMRSFRRLEKDLNRLESPVIREYGLTPTQYAVLDVLYAYPEATVQFILEHAMTTSGNIAIVLSNLQKRNLIRQKPDQKDRRSKRISLTAEGIQLFESVQPRHLQLLLQVFSQTSSAELNQAQQALARLQSELRCTEEEK